MNFVKELYPQWISVKTSCCLDTKPDTSTIKADRSTMQDTQKKKFNPKNLLLLI